MQAMISDDMPKFRSAKMRTSKIATAGLPQAVRDEYRNADDRRGCGRQRMSSRFEPVLLIAAIENVLQAGDARWP